MHGAVCSWFDSVQNILNTIYIIQPLKEVYEPINIQDKQVSNEQRAMFPIIHGTGHLLYSAKWRRDLLRHSRMKKMTPLLSRLPVYIIYRPTGRQHICAHGPVPPSCQLCDRLGVIRLDVNDSTLPLPLYTVVASCTNYVYFYANYMLNILYNA